MYLFIWAGNEIATQYHWQLSYILKSLKMLKNKTWYNDSNSRYHTILNSLLWTRSFDINVIFWNKSKTENVIIFTVYFEIILSTFKHTGFPVSKSSFLKSCFLPKMDYTFVDVVINP